MIPNIQHALRLGFHQLKKNSMSARLDAELLLAHALSKNRVYLYTYPEVFLTSIQWHTFQHLLQQRERGIPIAYLIGFAEFWSLPLKINGHTLIPRAESELLVELVLALLGDQSNVYLLELGTGSGAISLALAKERPQWKITACEFSHDALAIAKENASRLNLKNIDFLQSDWFSSLNAQQTFTAIISNPPYLADSDPHLIAEDIRFEPRQALVSGPNGYEAIQYIIQAAIPKLICGGLLLLEHGFDQKNTVLSMLQEFGYLDTRTWQDLQKLDRVSGGFKQGCPIKQPSLRTK